MCSFAIAGFFAAISLAHVASCAYSIFAYARHRDARELVWFGLFNAALVVFDSGLVLTFFDPAAESPALALVEAGRVASALFLTHYVLTYARSSRSRVLMGTLYGASALFGLAASLGLLARGAAERRTSSFFGFEVVDLWMRPSVAGVFVIVLWLGSVLFALVALGQAIARGRREGIALAGAIVLGGTAIFDAARSFGWIVGPPLSPVGYAVFVVGVMMTLLSRFTALRRQLEARASDLKDRARTLARAYADLRAAQDELVRKEQLAAVGELSAVVAHEVRNPLAIISNAVATLRRSEISAADRETLLSILDEESSRLNRLVSDLLRYARPMKLEREPVMLRDIAERALSLVSGRPNISMEIRETEPVGRVTGDAGLLRHVLENLVNNAVQAMPEGGTITISLSPTERKGEPGVELQIEDTGEGMDTQVRKRALDPFFTTRPSGTGLGLAIVARIIDAHGGHLAIKSMAGVGTVMEIFLPFAGSSTRSRARLSSAPERTSSLPPLPRELKQALEGSDAEHSKR